jgi:hypothetical protein
MDLAHKVESRAYPFLGVSHDPFTMRPLAVKDVLINDLLSSSALIFCPKEELVFY